MKEKDFLEKFYVSKSQLLGIIEDTELPKPPAEVRILHVGNDKYLVFTYDTHTGEGSVLYDKK